MTRPIRPRTTWTDKEKYQFMEFFMTHTTLNKSRSEPIHRLLPLTQTNTIPKKRHITNLIRFQQLSARLGEVRTKALRDTYYSDTGRKKRVLTRPTPIAKENTMRKEPKTQPQIDFESMMNKLGDRLESRIEGLKEELLLELIDMIPSETPKSLDKPIYLDTKSLVPTKEPITRRVVVIGLWDGAVSKIDTDNYPYLDIKFCRENTELDRNHQEDAALVQVVISTAHVPKGLSRKYAEHIHCTGGYSMLRSTLEKLDKRVRLINEDDLELERNQRPVDSPKLRMVNDIGIYRSDNGWKLTIEVGKEAKQHLNGRWVLRNELGKFLDSSYNLDLLGECNNLELVG